MNKKTNKAILFVGIILCVIGITSVVYADSIASRLAGKILLQVEENGEGWYINPANQERYFLGRAEDAFELMRKLGLGIANKDLEQIPIATDSPALPQEQPATIKEEGGNKEDGYIVKAIGDEIELKTIRFKVNSFEEAEALIRYNLLLGTQTHTSKEGAKFIIIDIDITNTTKSEFNFFSEGGVILVDEKSRQFTTYDDTIYNIDNYLNVRNLSPDIKENGLLVYEVPEDSISYSLKIQNAANNDIYLISLK